MIGGEHPRAGLRPPRRKDRYFSDHDMNKEEKPWDHIASRKKNPAEAGRRELALLILLTGIRGPALLAALTRLLCLLLVLLLTAALLARLVVLFLILIAHQNVPFQSID